MKKRITFVGLDTHKNSNETVAFPVEFRLRIVKLCLEEGYSPKLLVEQFGISTHSIQRWVIALRLYGAAGVGAQATRNTQEPHS